MDQGRHQRERTGRGELRKEDEEIWSTHTSNMTEQTEPKERNRSLRLV